MHCDEAVYYQMPTDCLLEFEWLLLVRMESLIQYQTRIYAKPAEFLLQKYSLLSNCYELHWWATNLLVSTTHRPSTLCSRVQHWPREDTHLQERSLSLVAKIRGQRIHHRDCAKQGRADIRYPQSDWYWLTFYLQHHQQTLIDKLIGSLDQTLKSTAVYWNILKSNTIFWWKFPTPELP